MLKIIKNIKGRLQKLVKRWKARDVGGGVWGVAGWVVRLNHGRII